MSTKAKFPLIPRPTVELMADPPAHPGEVLREDFLVPLGITHSSVAPLRVDGATSRSLSGT